ncbi:hypothetical protein Pmar_PMAR027617, partial [Perkinsus marinus ATCC 50983]
LVLYRNLAKRVYLIVDPASCAYKLDLEYFEIAWQVASAKPSEGGESSNVSVASSSPMSVESEDHQLHRPDADEVQCALAGLIYIQAIKGYLSYEHKKFVFSKQNAFPPIDKWKFDHYAELGVHRHSSDKEVREAYLKAVKQHHPDAGGNHDKFVRVQQAYEHINRDKKDGVPKSTNTTSSTSSSSSSSSYSYPNSGGSGFGGSGGFGGSTWWWSSGRGRPKGEDFAFDEREFEKAWNKFKRTQRRQGSGQWAQYYQSDSEDEDYFDESDEERIFERRRNNSPKERRRERESARRAYARYADENMNPRDRKPKATAGHSVVDIATAHTYHSALLNGTYKRIGIFNGRPAYRRISGNERWPVFLYYSERFNDWKLHSQLRDTNLCYAFLDDPECSNAFDLMKSTEPWFVFNDRKHRYEILSDMKLTLPTRAGATTSAGDSDATDDAGPPATAEEVEAVSSWSAGELKQWLEDCGMAKKAELCFEKNDLVSAVRELMKSGVRPKKGPHLGKEKTDDRFVDDRGADEEKRKEENNHEELTLLDMTKVKGREVKLASRMKSDGKNIKPPRLQTSYHAFGNRVEFAYKSGQPVEEFLATYGDRGRVYGVFVEGQYKFSVIWDRKSGRWARANSRYDSSESRKDDKATKTKK